ncbi:MAG: chemotaxis protein CheB [Pirellulaceae bacterium]
MSEGVDISRNEVDSVAADAPTYIVGIGASAGGLESLEAFFDNAPIQSGMAYVVVQHLSPDFRSLMDELLARHTSMRIVKVEDGERVERDTVYLLQPKHNITLVDGRLRLTRHNPPGGFNLPIDIFFSSLAKDAATRAIAIILSGTGSDGSRGIRDVHAAGGLVLVQDVESAAFDGMPRAALATDLADVVCEPKAMPAKLEEFARDPELFTRGQADSATKEANGDLATVFRLFRGQFGIDFSLYKPSTIQRRIERRMQLVRALDLSEYLRTIEADSDELDRLYRELLVEVTHFFRDPEAFDIIEKEVAPRLINERHNETDIRVWVSGCATGEEAYTLAMIIHDVAERCGRSIPLKVFASDVHEKSMEIAGHGVYSADDIQSVPDHYRRKYFVENGDRFQVCPDLRRKVVFARHDVTRDPPFTRIDLLSCRNVLIYLEPEVQRRVLAMFHFGLRVGGALMLGPSESVGPYGNEFETVDQTWRVFRKLRDQRLTDIIPSPSLPPASYIVAEQPAPKVRGNGSSDGWLSPLVYEELLARYVPPGLLVNEYYELVHTFGEARKLLTQPTGRPTLEIGKLVEGELRTAMMAALHRANHTKTAVTFRNIPAETPVGSRRLDITVEPYNRGSRKLFLLCLEDSEPLHAAEVHRETIEYSGEQSNRIEDLEQELGHVRESLQMTVEELETSNEELQSTNQELIAANEELQSTNEELHSVNEELYTVNSEYQRKIEELTNLTNDLHNFLESTDIGTVFLDDELRIRKYTPAIAAAFNILDQDIGRPIEHISYNVDSPGFLSDLKRVLATGQAQTQEISNRSGRVFLNRVRPYQDELGQKVGLVLTFSDITELRKATRQVSVTEQELALSQKELQEFVYAVSHDLQAPLRHIEHFASLFRNYQLDAQFEGGVRGIESSLSRLRNMIEALLTYSRVNTHGTKFATVNLNDVMEQAQSQLRSEIEAVHAVITSQPLPTIMGDREQLVGCFRHLLDNAIKFCGSTPLRVHVGVEKRGDGWLISIHDNGVGIERRHYEVIFVIFQRLGIKEQTEGLGLGLPLCRRIIERHQGWIWVESTPGKGSTFFVQLPAAEHPVA